MPLDQRFAAACINANERYSAASARLRAANAELQAAERELRMAGEELAHAEKLYYAQPDYGSTSSLSQETK